MRGELWLVETQFVRRLQQQHNKHITVVVPTIFGCMGWTSTTHTKKETKNYQPHCYSTVLYIKIHR